MSKAWRVDATTGDILRDDEGQPVIDDSPITDLFLAIGIQVDTSPGDPELGSTIPEIVGGDPVADPESSLTSAALTALERLVDAGTIDRDPQAQFSNNCLTLVERGLTFTIPVG